MYNDNSNNPVIRTGQTNGNLSFLFCFTILAKAATNSLAPDK